MIRSLWSNCILLLLLSRADAEPKYDMSAVSRYVSRPDLVAPKWEVTVYDQSRVAPGYWFVAPFEDVGQNKAGQPWVGPYIFDGRGELVWSGTNMFGYWNVFDFRISDVLGEKHLTLFTGMDGMATVLNDDYTIRDQWRMGWVGIDTNMHELNFIHDGTRALITKEHHQKATVENSRTIGWEGECKVLHQGFQEMDVKTWEPVFEWNSGDHMFLNESTNDDGPLEGRCNGGWSWDYFHINSVDKSKDGDYFVSGRHVDTIYKVSGKDGSIIWRLGGRMTDFEMNGLHFSRQHDIRYRGENGTHTFLTILDNAKGLDPAKPTDRMSRGLVIAVQTDVQPMIAHTLLTIDHPDGIGSYAPRRGNLQKLSFQDNIWIQWSEQAEQSEHAKDGKLLMKAKMKTPWMGTYRSYKFPFVGRPAEPIAAHSQAYSTPSNGSRTLVHVSWNGATEVDSWNLYKTTRDGAPRIFVANLPRQGFETALAYDGFASFVLVEALDKDRTVLGTSAIVTTNAPAELNNGVAEEVLWLQKVAHAAAVDSTPEAQQAADEAAAEKGTGSGFPLPSTTIGLFVLGFVASIGAVLLVWRFRARRIFNFAIAPFRSEKSSPEYLSLSSRDLESTADSSSTSHEYSDK